MISSCTLNIILQNFAAKYGFLKSSSVDSTIKDVIQSCQGFLKCSKVFHHIKIVFNPPASAGETRDAASIPESGRSPGGGHGNPLQYSGLENPMDRGAWRATVHKITASQTRLKLLSTQAPTTCHLLSRSAAHSPFPGILDSDSSAVEPRGAPWGSRLLLFAGPSAMKKKLRCDS